LPFPWHLRLDAQRLFLVDTANRLLSEVREEGKGKREKRDKFLISRQKIDFNFLFWRCLMSKISTYVMVRVR
jgi:hypothetical protein